MNIITGTLTLNGKNNERKCSRVKSVTTPTSVQKAISSDGSRTTEVMAIGLYCHAVRLYDDN